RLRQGRHPAQQRDLQLRQAQRRRAEEHLRVGVLNSPMPATPEPYTVHVDDGVLDDLRRRLDAARLPDQAPGEPWSLGIPVSVMRTALDHWRNRYDWRAREARIN